MKLRSLLVCCTLIFSGVALAKEAAPMAADVAIEKRMVAISEELRCLVCQNESLSGSHADLAQDLEIAANAGMHPTPPGRLERTRGLALDLAEHPLHGPPGSLQGAPSPPEG